MSAPALVVLAAGMAKRYGGCKPLAPVGPHGEAVIDLTAGDALRAGFEKVLVVIGEATGPAIAYHIRRCWPKSLDVELALQAEPLGTAHALLSSRSLVSPDSPFGVVNADDLYGSAALGALSEHLLGGGGHALVAFRLRDTLVSSSPVTRGICEPAPDDPGRLGRITERRSIAPGPGGSFVSTDGLEPEKLDGDSPVSVNLWGFTPSIWPVIEAEVRSAYPDIGPDGRRPPPASDGSARGSSGAEVLLPEVVATMIARDEGRVALLRSSDRCIGVTHPGDLPAVRAEIAAMIARGERPESPWALGVPPPRAPGGTGP